MNSKRKVYPLIAITGLEGAGKTTLIHRLKTGEFRENFSPTIGFQVDILRKDDYRFDIVDLGGHIAFRTAFWENFVTSCHGCIFIFDRADEEKLTTAKEWLWKVEEWLPKDANLAFFANKSDLEDVMSLEDIVQGLDLAKLSAKPMKSFRIFETSSVNGQNIDECWNWLTNSIRRRMESKSQTNILAFELLDDRLEPVVRHKFVGEESEGDLSDIMEAFHTHSIKMVDSLPHINIGEYVVHILRKGDYYGISYVKKDDDQSLVREVSLSMLFESIYKERREQEITKEFLYEVINSINFS